MNERKPLSLPKLREMHARGEKIAMLTAYDASFARLYDACGVDVILVGDSLGNVIQGRDGTTPVSLEQMAYHVESVARGSSLAWLIGDLPFGSYQPDPGRRADGQARGRRMDRRGGPVHRRPGHPGVRPPGPDAADGARAGRPPDPGPGRERRGNAGPAREGTRRRGRLDGRARAGHHGDRHPGHAGSGAGAHTSGQVLVLHDAIGATHGHVPKFVRNFMEGQTSLAAAVAAYVRAVKDGAFPVEGIHTY